MLAPRPATNPARGRSASAWRAWASWAISARRSCSWRRASTCARRDSQQTAKDAMSSFRDGGALTQDVPPTLGGGRRGGAGRASAAVGRDARRLRTRSTARLRRARAARGRRRRRRRRPQLSRESAALASGAFEALDDHRRGRAPRTARRPPARRVLQERQGPHGHGATLAAGALLRVSRAGRRADART